MKKKDEAGSREKEILNKLKVPLEKERPLRTVKLAPEEEKVIKSYPLLSRREMVVVLNVSDEGVSDTSPLEQLRGRFADQGVAMVQIAAEMETEITALETAEERSVFMREMGIDDTALHVLTARFVDGLGLISFFTASGAVLASPPSRRMRFSPRSPAHPSLRRRCSPALPCRK